MNERKSARSVRLKKEARAMFWPWCAVVIAGALRFESLTRSEREREVAHGYSDDLVMKQPA